MYMYEQLYYREAHGAFVVYDVSRESTLKEAALWKENLDHNLNEDDFKLPVILLGNKCDLPHDTNAQELDDFCKQNGFLRWFETSAKTDERIDEAVNSLVDEIMKNTHVEPTKLEPDIIDFNQQKEEQKSSCC